MKLPIAIKLVAITISLLVSVTALIALQSSEYFAKEVRETHEQSNDRQAENRANEVEGLLNNYVDKVKIVASLLYKQYPNPKDKQEALDLSFKTDRDLVNVEIYEMLDGQTKMYDHVVNLDYLKSYGLTGESLAQVRKARPFPMTAVFAGKIEVINSSVPKGAPLVTIGIPFVKDAYENITHIAVADIRLDRLQKTFATQQASEIFLIDQNGIVLAHPNDQLPLQAASLKDDPIVEQTVKNKTRLNQLRSFENPIDKKSYYGISYKTPFGVAVVAQVPEEIITEPAKIVTRKAFYVGGLVISGSLFLIFLFSIMLTKPIEVLADMTNEVSKGNYDVDPKTIKARDEVGDLASAFDEMIEGLRQRAKAYKVMSQALGRTVVETLMNMKEEEMGGMRKPVAVLFSDLRDFTKFSEGHSPEEVVIMLNEYFDVMVKVIEKYNGWLDKFIGDAIMAVWGVPYTGENDEAKAVMAALEMRVELNSLNDRRIAAGLGPIKIGIGVHVGDAIVGKIGAQERANLTVIGDTVNQASRIEASTKAFGTDCLLSQETVDKIKDYFVVEYAGAAEVKGKTDALKLYKLRGYIDEEGQQQLIRTPYSDYEAGHADKVKIAG